MKLPNIGDRVLKFQNVDRETGHGALEFTNEVIVQPFGAHGSSRGGTVRVQKSDDQFGLQIVVADRGVILAIGYLPVRRSTEKEAVLRILEDGPALGVSGIVLIFHWRSPLGRQAKMASVGGESTRRST